MKMWRAYWDAPVASASTWWLRKSLLGLLAFDLWLVMPSHGGRYGVGEFNVAHFGWLDAIQPLPSPAIYVGLLLGLGVLAFSIAVADGPRWMRAVLFGGYTWAWSMSMLDSYQHHYLLSLLLLSLIWTGSDTAGELKEQGLSKSQKPDPAHVMLTTSCAIVYIFTAITKLAPDWRSGEALRRIAGGNEAIGALRGALGLEGDSFWPTLALLTITLQLLCSTAFIMAGQRSRFQSRRSQILISLLGLAPLTFHIGAESLGLKIGWFSYYMVALTLVLFSPPQLLHSAAIWFAPMTRFFRELHEELPRGLVAVIIISGLSLCYFGHEVDLPGSQNAMIVLAVFVAGVSCAAIVRGKSGPWWPRLLGVLAGGLLMWTSIAGSSVRFDYYRYVGGDMRRRGQLEQSLQAYIRANRYAPTSCEALTDMDRPPERRRCDRQREEDAVRQALTRARGLSR